MTGNRSGLVKRFHGARQSRILAGDPLAGWKKKRDKLLVLSVRNTLCCIPYSSMAVSKLWAWPIAVFKMVEDTDNQIK